VNPPAVDIYEFEGFRLDPARRRLWKGDAAVPLTSRVFDTLVYLVEHPDTVLDKERLMEAVWPDSIVEENNLTQNISTLRRIFGEMPGSHRFIVTVPGRGYRFVAAVKIGSLENILSPENAPAPAVATEGERATLPPPTPRPRLAPSLLAGGMVVALATLVFFFWRGPWRNPLASTAPVRILLPEKSIAVLPFANLSDDKENAFFSEGVQDDILTALAKINDLKVISRTSVANYVSGPARNLRQIGQELGVANILEGSVRRAGGKVRVTAQLIETRTNTHIWAETYDRELQDVFAIQSEIAQQIATALQAKFAPEEKARLDVQPTRNSDAYALYLMARGRAGMPNSSQGDDVTAEELYLQAIGLDPGFALAYARASILNSGIASETDKPERTAKARAQAEQALRLSPDLGEAHMALGLCLFWAEKNYPAALKEFDRAAASLPNNAEIPGYRAGIYRRQGRWREAVAEFDRAKSLDPRNRQVVFLAGNNHLFLRHWDEAALNYHRSLELAPDAVAGKVGLAYLELYQRSDLAAARKLMEQIPDRLDFEPVITTARWDFAMLARDYAAADALLAKSQGENFPGLGSGDLPKTFFAAQLAYAKGDFEAARRLFEAALPIVEQHVRDRPEMARQHADLGLLYAWLGRKDDALRESNRAIELEPESQNAFHGVSYSARLALVYARVGEADKALALIEHLLTTPGAVNYPSSASSITLAELRLRREWDPLRSNPRFEKILAGPEPKTVY
jgi:TolB-like protein/DNA-binding winged helix-turn-helix (wHTH) protein/Flp pilus assembly protein TadD